MGVVSHKNYLYTIRNVSRGWFLNDVLHKVRGDLHRITVSKNMKIKI